MVSAGDGLRRLGEGGALGEEGRGECQQGTGRGALGGGAGTRGAEGRTHTLWFPIHATPSTLKGVCFIYVFPHPHIGGQSPVQ